ncbi:hypothetical protein C8Q78DRAFT_973142 [Trametes maxima]|nr:hypothetical protein C8Q78DRAFT_973142 [Trametes maxima]
MPALRLIRQVAPSDVLAVTICSLEVLQETSDAITIVPFLGNIVGAALGIARTVERLRGDKDRFVRLARRVSELSRHIDESVAADPEAIDDNPKVNLIELQTLFTRIREDVETYSRRSSLSRFFLQSSIADLIDDRMDQLDSVWRAFDVSPFYRILLCPVDSVVNMLDCLRLFRWSDLRCLRVRGTYSVSGHVVGHEWEGKWDGRAVVIRTVRERPETHWLGLSLSCRHHPYVAQVIGYSHPALSERFYVMDAGTSVPNHIKPQ